MGSLSLFAISLGVILFGPHQRTLAQTAHARASASTHSAIYVAFFETVNRDPERDTIYVEEMSTVFPGMSSHYDSVAPGLGLVLAKASKHPRPTASLRLPAPIRILPDTTVMRLRDEDFPSSLAAVKGRAQGSMGLWRFSPIVYSADDNEACSSTRSTADAPAEKTLSCEHEKIPLENGTFGEPRFSSFTSGDMNH